MSCWCEYLEQSSQKQNGLILGNNYCFVKYELQCKDETYDIVVYLLHETDRDLIKAYDYSTQILEDFYLYQSP